MKFLLTLTLLLATVAVVAPAMAQERAAHGALETQMTWSALSGQISSMGTKVDASNKRMDQFVLCGKKGMLYAPGHLNASGVVDSDADGCLTVSGGGAVPTDYCYAVRASRWYAPHCDKDYYMKAAPKTTDNNWDGYGAVCCYIKPGKDARVEANKAGFVTKSGSIASSIGLSYNAIAAACAAQPNTYSANNVTCPVADVLP